MRNSGEPSTPRPETLFSIHYFMKRTHILTMFAAILLLSSCRHDEGKQHEGGKFIVTTPIRKDTIIFNEYVCQIHSIQHIELRALERGYLQNIYVDEGQFVEKGQLMFQIMPTIFQAELQKAKAEVRFAEIEYLNTKALS